MKKVGDMNFEELSAHIDEKDKIHKREMTNLRALLRVVADQNDAAKRAAQTGT